MAEIRRMRECDLDAVAAMEQLIFSEPWSRRSFEETYLKRDNCYLVACEEAACKFPCSCSVCTGIPAADNAGSNHGLNRAWRKRL